jgi:hypothetical protein
MVKMAAMYLFPIKSDSKKYSPAFFFKMATSKRSGNMISVVGKIRVNSKARHLSAVISIHSLINK